MNGDINTKKTQVKKKTENQREKTTTITATLTQQEHNNNKNKALLCNEQIEKHRTRRADKNVARNDN